MSHTLKKGFAGAIPSIKALKGYEGSPCDKFETNVRITLVEGNISNILVIGLDVVSLAVSARRAGYQVFAVDYFGDQDLKKVCHETRSVLSQRIGETCGQVCTSFRPETLLHLTKSLLKENQIDAVLLSSGLDDYPDVLSGLNDLVPILGNPPNVISRVRDKMKFFRELRRLRIPHPQTAIVYDFEEAKEKSKEIGYPVVVKPSSGFGGVGIRKVRSHRELKKTFQEVSSLNGKVLIQEYISGIPASASLISSSNKVAVLTLNEQLLGVREVGQLEPFGYCGNLIPLSMVDTVKDSCKDLVKRVVLHFGLVGSNGVDLVISEEGLPYVIEVNPRFQGTLECVERTLRTNVVRLHAEACVQGILPSIVKNTSFFCVRLILFAPHPSITPDLSTFKEVRDIPLPGVIIEKGEPVCSIFVKGSSKQSLLKRAIEIAQTIKRLLVKVEIASLC